MDYELFMTSYLYTAAEIRAIEQYVFSNSISDPSTLMQSAAGAAYQALRNKFPAAKNLVVCCGKGNNAADAMYVAILAAQDGLIPIIIRLYSEEELTEVAADALNKCRELGIKDCFFNKELEIKADVIIDGILGIGIQSPLQSNCCDFIQWINAQDAFKLAIDGSR